MTSRLSLLHFHRDGCHLGHSKATSKLNRIAYRLVFGPEIFSSKVVNIAVYYFGWLAADCYGVAEGKLTIRPLRVPAVYALTGYVEVTGHPLKHGVKSRGAILRLANQVVCLCYSDFKLYRILIAGLRLCWCKHLAFLLVNLN